MDNISIFTIIAIGWLIVITGILIWLFFVFKNLIKLAKNKEYISNSKEIKELKNEVAEFKKYSQRNLRKVGLVKYNPFGDTGGDHSFSLAILDDLKNGIIITSLHTREKTRVYLKDVFDGKAKIKLSDEESKSLVKALKN
jgi:hypothetical protein